MSALGPILWQSDIKLSHPSISASKSEEDFAKEMGMSNYQVRFMTSILQGTAFGTMVLKYDTQFHFYAEAVNMAGDMGLLDLE